MTDLVYTYLEENMTTFVPAKMLLDKHKTIIKTWRLCRRLIDLVVGFAMSLGLKKIDHWSPSYDCFSEGASLGEWRLPHAKSKAKVGSPLLFPYF